MKPLIEYILEEKAKAAQNGHWEKYCDEDTGEIISVWKWEDTEEFFKTFYEYEEKLNGIWEKIMSLNDDAEQYDKEASDIRLDLKDVDDEIKSLRARRKQLFIDMEEEIGQIDISNEKERDEKAQEYGIDINDLDEEISELNKKHVDLVAKIKELEEKSSQVYISNEATERKLWAERDALEKERDDALEKIRASYGPSPED